MGTQQRAERDVVTQRVGADRVEKITVNEGVPIWYWIVLFLALWADSPKRYAENLGNLLWRKK